MLYLTSFRIVADFLNNLNFLDISLQVHIQFIFPEKKKNVFAAILLKLIILGTMIFFPFSLTFFRQLVLREGIFGIATSLIPYFY